MQKFAFPQQSPFIFINLAERSLALMQNQQIYYRWPIAIGKKETPTPVGAWQIINKKILSGGIYGTRWLGLDAIGYGIHGTNVPHSIGSAASMGCVRMHNSDVELLFQNVSIGTMVYIDHFPFSPL